MSQDGDSSGLSMLLKPSKVWGTVIHAAPQRGSCGRKRMFAGKKKIWIMCGLPPKKLCVGIGLLIWLVHPMSVGCRSERRLGLRNVTITLFFLDQIFCKLKASKIKKICILVYVFLKKIPLNLYPHSTNPGCMVMGAPVPGLFKVPRYHPHAAAWNALVKVALCNSWQMVWTEWSAWWCFYFTSLQGCSFNQWDKYKALEQVAHFRTTWCPFHWMLSH